MPTYKLAHHIGVTAYLKLLRGYLTAEISRLWTKTDTTPAGILSGLTALGWAVVLSLSDLTVLGNMYANLSTALPLSWLAGYLLVLGVVQLGLTLTPFRRFRWLRHVAAGFAAATWSFVAFTALIAMPVTTAAAVYSVLALSSVWEFMRTE